MRRLFRPLQRFHRNEKGEGVMTMLMVVAAAAIVLLVVMNWGKGEFLTNVQTQVNNIIQGE